MNSWNPVTRLQHKIAGVETVLMRRENVIRLLTARFLIMLAMVLSFWLAMRHAI